jgi:hypothetical protein
MKKIIIPTMLVLGLLVGSCNTNTRTREHKETVNDNKTEVKDRYKSDSTEVKRDKTIKYDDQGNVKKEVSTEKTNK